MRRLPRGDPPGRGNGKGEGEFAHRGLGHLATDRLGVFRASGLPREEIHLGLREKGYNGATAVIPAEAWEVEVTLPRKPVGE